MDRNQFLKWSALIIAGSLTGHNFENRPMKHVADPTGAKKDRTNHTIISLFLSGDVMTGRGIDQVLPYSVDPVLYEPSVKNAHRYVELAEWRSGELPEDISYAYIWGDLLDTMDEKNPDVRVINLETSITQNNIPWPRKHIHYRMHPNNSELLKTAEIDICLLANNHTLDWGRTGLQDTLQVLVNNKIGTAGAGLNRDFAKKPAIINTTTGRLLVFSYGTKSAGIPKSWEAGEERSGVNYLDKANIKSADHVIKDINRYRKNTDVIIVSIHWGGNWGYKVPPEHREFARKLIDSGVADIIHGHSSHHPKGIEMYKNRLILYGCGDLINDYEGISGREQYRDELSLAYFPKLNADGSLLKLAMVPFTIFRFRLHRAGESDSIWIAKRLNRESQKFGCSIERIIHNQLLLRW